MAKLKPADTKLEDLDRTGLLWLASRALPSHWEICLAMRHQLLTEGHEAFKAYLLGGDAENRLSAEATKALAAATTTERLSQRAREARWTAYDNLLAAGRRAQAKTEAHRRRYQRLEAQAATYDAHLDALSAMVRP